MQALLRLGLAAAASARFSNQPESEPPRTPAAESVNQSRRDSMGADMDSPYFPPSSLRLAAVRRTARAQREGGWKASMIEHELGTVEQGPEHVGQGIVVRRASTAAALDGVLHEA